MIQRARSYSALTRVNRSGEEALARNGNGGFAREIGSRRPLFEHRAQDAQADLEVALHGRPDLLEKRQVFRLRLAETELETSAPSACSSNA